MSEGNSLFKKIIRKFHSRFVNYEGKIEYAKIARYFFSKDILNIPIRVVNKIQHTIFNITRTSSKGILFDLSLPKNVIYPITFKQPTSPTVSIIIPIFNQIDYTTNCIIGLFENISNKYSYEIIIVNDQSTDESEHILNSTFKGITIITNDVNIGFVRSCNKGASAARGKYICFLNNDTYVQPYWLESLIDLIERDHTIGLVGSMLIYPNGMLQEAGNIIWKNGLGWNLGRKENRFNSAYNYVREVDYISGASILLNKNDFNTLGGFDELYVPAYYEDTDLCFNMRYKLNKKVVYCPQSKIIHYEGITSGTNLYSGVKKHQAINQIKFLNKWKAELDQYHLSYALKNIPQSISKYNAKSILIIDSYVPCYNKESGSNRLFQIIKIIQHLGYKITFLPDNQKADQPYTSELQAMGVEVLFKNQYFQTSCKKQLLKIINTIDIVWICRPELFEKYYPILTTKTHIKFIYDTIDLHFLRLKRENELFPHKKNNWRAVKKSEILSANRADVALAITPVDEAILKDLAVKNTSVIPNIHTLQYHSANSEFEFNNRSGLLFIGGYSHTPNIDAVVWLIRHIMPLVWAKIPDIKVTLLGNNPTDTIKNLASDKVIIPGFIDDVSPYFNSHKVFVAPLRYGAGMKGKIGQSLEFGLPIVSTNIGIEGMNMNHEIDVLVANTESEIAKSIIRLYTDQDLWIQIRKGGNKIIEPYTPAAVEQKLKQLFEQL